MTILTHTVIGSLVGANFGNPVLAALGGLASHFIFDVVPHNDYLYYFYKPSKSPYASPVSQILLAATVVFLLAVFLFLPSPFKIPALLGSALAILPDALTGLWDALGKKPSLFDKFHGLTHERLTLAELLHNLTHPANKVNVNDKLELGFEKLKNSPAGRVGWALEVLLELAILGFFLTQIFPLF